MSRSETTETTDDETYLEREAGRDSEDFVLVTFDRSFHRHEADETDAEHHHPDEDPDDYFEFSSGSDSDPILSGGTVGGGSETLPNPIVLSNNGDNGRPDLPVEPEPDPDAAMAEDSDPDPAPAPLDQPDRPAAPTEQGRPAGTSPSAPQDTPPSPAPGDDNAEFGRPPEAVPDPVETPITTYTSGGPSASSYNVVIEFVGTWTTDLQSAFTEAADYLSMLILADLPDSSVDGTPIDDMLITATLEGIDGVGGVLGSAGPRNVRGDGTYLPVKGEMTFDSEDAQNQLGLGNWETIVLHEMMHALGFGTLWSLMGLTTGSVAGGDIRFTGINAVDVYQTEFPVIAGADSGSLLGIPVETEGGPGTAGGHWDEVLFNAEIMTGFVDAGGFVSLMTIASFEDMGYDTVFDNPYSATDLSGPIPTDPLLDLFA